MNLKMIKNDFLRSKLITITTTLFVAAAALLVSLAAILLISLTGSIDTLMSDAKTPHFMQMHSGQIDLTKVESFASQNETVDEFQAVKFLNMDNAKIILGENSLSGSIQDNGFSVQNKNFDYLLDLNGDIIHAADGELYVPICYLRDNTAKVGDTAVISGKNFTVAGFLRDSQMNPTLSSSKRFLVSEQDYLQLESLGTVEYLIEFRLSDVNKLGTFEADYAAAGLPANGPTITYPLFKMLNAMSDGILIGIILLVSILVVMIALLCIRFTLLAKIEVDYREIGVMKAIGMRVSDIKRIYLMKYAAIGLAGCTLGVVLSFFFKNTLTENIRLTMGESDNAAMGGLLGLIGALLILLTILLYVNGVLRRFRKLSAAEAISFGSGGDRRKGSTGLSLCKSKMIDTNILLGIKDVLARKGLYTTMLIVLVLAAFIIIVPQNLYSTISADSFATYMGIGDCDIRLDIQQTDRIAEKAAEIAAQMNSDERIANYTVLTTKIYQVKTDDGNVESIKIELGDHSQFPISYSEGKAPETADEIALSSIYAEELGKNVGDSLKLAAAPGEKTLTVSGIYSDITNGGKTAKASFEDTSAAIMWSILYVSLADQADVQGVVLDYAGQFDFAKVTDTQEYILQIYGQTLYAVKQASIAAIAVAILIIVLVTLLFMKLLVAKDRYEIAVMKACGFYNSDIQKQYGARAFFILILGILLGTLLANTVGEALAGIAVSSIGASTFKFTVNPLFAYLLCPLMMLCSVLSATILGTRDAGKIDVSENIKE